VQQKGISALYIGANKEYIELSHNSDSSSAGVQLRITLSLLLNHYGVVPIIAIADP